MFTLEQLWACLAEGVTQVEGHTLILSVICLSSWSPGPWVSAGSGPRTTRARWCACCAGPALPGQRPLPGPACSPRCPPGLTLSPSQARNLSVWLPSLDEPLPSSTCAIRVGDKGGWPAPARLQLTLRCGHLDNGVAGLGWHPVLLGASGPAPPSPGLRASPCSPQCAHQASFLGPLPLFAALSLLRWGDQAAPFPQLSLIFLSSPL